MVTVGLVCVAMGLVSWPSPPRRPIPSARPPRRRSRGGSAASIVRVSGAAMAAATLVLLAVAWTVAGAVVLAVLVGTVAVLLRWSAVDRRHRRDLVELAATLRMLSRELRAGAPPEQAVAVCVAAAGTDGPTAGTAWWGRDSPPLQGAAKLAAVSRRANADAPPLRLRPATDPSSPAPASAVPSLSALRRDDARSRSLTVRVLQELVLPSDPNRHRSAVPDGSGAGTQPGSGRPRRPRPVDDLVVRLVGGWRLALRCGLPLTGLVDGVTAVAQERVDAVDARRAEVAGPRLSGWVLAALPVMGLLLGGGMGADPVGVLLAPDGPGPVLLVVGMSLTCGGLLWSARIVRR